MDKSQKKKKRPRQFNQQEKNENETKLVAPIAPTPIILGNKPLKKNTMHEEKNATLNSNPENKKKSHQKQLPERDIEQQRKHTQVSGGINNNRKSRLQKYERNAERCAGCATES